MSKSPAQRRLFHIAVGWLGLLLVLTVLAPVVLVVQLGAQEKKPAKKEPVAPLRLVPEDVAAFVHIRVADLAKSKAFQLIPARERASLLREICFGIPPEQVETVTVASSPPDGMTPFDLLMGRPSVYHVEPKNFHFDKGFADKGFPK